MHECVFDWTARIIDSYNLIVVVLICAVSLTARNANAIGYSCTLLLFYAFSFFFHCEFKSDQFTFVWRYVFWACIDICFILTLLGLVKLKIVERWVVVAATFAEVVAVGAHIINAIDMHFWDGFYTDWFYPQLIWTTNILFLLIGLCPLIIQFLERKTQYA